MVNKMALRVIKENIQVKDLLDDDFLSNLEEKFGDYDIIPVGISISLEKEGIIQDSITVIHREESDFKENRVIIDANKSPETIDKILESFD